MLDSIILAAVSLFFLATGADALARPQPFALRLGLSTDRLDGALEIRAQYGGFFLVAGSVTAAPFAGLLSANAAFLIMMVIFGGLILGRLIGCIIDRNFQGYSSTIRLLFLVDALGFLCGIWGLMKI